MTSISGLNPNVFIQSPAGDSVKVETHASASCATLYWVCCDRLTASGSTAVRAR